MNFFQRPSHDENSIPDASTQNESQFGPLAPHYDELMKIVPYDQWAEYVMTLFAYAGHDPRRVLDCACGTGNVTFELASRGLHCVGVDISASMIEVARQKLKTWPHRFAPRFEVGDLATFELNETFDSATCLYDSLNYILEPEKLRAAFAQVGKHIERGGFWVFDMNSEWALVADLFTQSNLNPRQSLNYDWRAHFDRHSRICSVKMKFQRRDKNGELETFYETHRERAYSLDEVTQMLESTGWKLRYSFDAYTLNRPHDRSERWFFVAQKS
jgi:ubiquinone/menaquinone biosynthesis C-methylase UbiE